jgi:hypothetical protein
MGWYSQALHCYYLLMSPWPAPGDSRIAAIRPYHKPGDGGYYMRTCSGGAPTAPMRDYVWMPNKPPGYGWRLSPDVLAARAVRMLRLGGPQITLSPPLGKRQVVGLPMWAWTKVTSSTWGTHSATAAAGGESVTATAVSQSIRWNWGDGTSTTCSGPGTPWTSAYGGDAASPTCGHTYTHDSRGGEYAITAATTWHISWVGGGLASGAHGQLTVVAPARAQVHVSELQAINVPNAR